MGWRERLRPASFKGIRFYVEDHESQHGRRLSVNEYPFRDLPYTEDMGRSARRFGMTAYLVGKNYMGTRDALIAAVEAGGPGQLVHPYMGTKTVIAEEARVRETQRDGGYVEINISFVEAGSKTFPNSLPVPGKLAELGADRLISISQSIFENGLTLDGVSQFVTESYAGGLGEMASIFDGIQLAGGINLQTTVGRINQAADWVASLAELKDPSLSLLGNIGGVASRIISLFQGVLDLGGSSKSSAKNLSKFSNFTPARTVSTTQEGQTVNENAAVLERYVRTVGLAEESKALVRQPYAYYEEAIAARQYLLERIDTVATDSASDDEYDALQNLRKQVGDAIPPENERLPRLDTVTLPQTEPALVLSYELYESVVREKDIVARNNIRHPGFVPGGQPLEILKDA